MAWQTAIGRHAADRFTATGRFSRGGSGRDPGGDNGNGNGDENTLTEMELGALVLTATYNSIGIELPFTGDEDANATATVEFKKAGDEQWREGLPLWRTGGTLPAFYGSVLLCDDGTEYDVRITVTDPGAGEATVTDSVTTRTDNISSPDTVLAGTIDRYVDAENGDDSNDGTSPASAWRTLQKAMTSAPSGAIVQVGPGSYTRTTVSRTSPITLVAQYPAVDDSGNIINHGQHSIVDFGYVTAPSDSGEPYAGVWQEVTIIGPGYGGAPAGATYKIWKWANTPARVGIYGPTTLAYAPSREAIPERVAHWSRKGNDLQTPEGWVEKLYTNQTYNYGWTTFTNASEGIDIYVRLPLDKNPNDYYVTLGNIRFESSLPGSTFFLNGPDIRISGFEIRTGGIHVRSSASRAIIDHNLLVLANVSFSGSQPSTYGSDHVVEHNYIVDTGLWTDDHANKPAIPWVFIKGEVTNADGTSAGGRIGEVSETGGVSMTGGARRVVIRHNVIDGPFNGIAAYNAGYDRYATQDLDVHDNVIRHISDDAFEPEQVAINWRLWNNRVEDTAVVLSTGPVSYGPVYLFRNEAWRIGSHGVGKDNHGNVGVGTVYFKYSGASNPTARIYVLHNTFWTDLPDVSGGDQYAGGGSNSEAFFLRNNLIRATRYAFQKPSGAKWNEDYNHFCTSDATRGLSNYTTNVATYRSDTGQGAHTNVEGDFVTVSVVDNNLADPENGDLTLADESDFIDAGTPVPNLSDRAGVDYQGNAPDLGYAEKA